MATTAEAEHNMKNELVQQIMSSEFVKTCYPRLSEHTHAWIKIAGISKRDSKLTIAIRKEDSFSSTARREMARRRFDSHHLIVAEYASGHVIPLAVDFFNCLTDNTILVGPKGAKNGFGAPGEVERKDKQFNYEEASRIDSTYFKRMPVDSQISWIVKRINTIRSAARRAEAFAAHAPTLMRYIRLGLADTYTCLSNLVPFELNLVHREKVVATINKTENGFTANWVDETFKTESNVKLIQTVMQEFAYDFDHKKLVLDGEELSLNLTEVARE